MPKKPINAYLIAGGIFHDTDFARLELLKLLAEHPDILVRIAEDYSDAKAIAETDFLITYTCNVVPTPEQQTFLKDYIASGKRWFALHGTNTVLEILEDGKVDTPESAPTFNEVLGSTFIAHPPIRRFMVTPTNSKHPLIKDIDAFETEDEQYYIKTSRDAEILLESQGKGPGDPFFVRRQVEDQSWPVFYTHPFGQGEVLYLTLGHCNGHYHNPLQEYVEKIERCSWENPIFYKLLRRGIAWAAA